MSGDADGPLSDGSDAAVERSPDHVNVAAFLADLARSRAHLFRLVFGLKIKQVYTVVQS